MTRPIILALALDHDVEELVRMAAELGRRLGAPIVPVHTLGALALTSEHQVREQLAPHLNMLVEDSELTVEPLTVLRGAAAPAIVELAATRGAQLVMVGGGGTATLRSWVFGSTAEAVVRSALSPVYIVRGVFPLGASVLCPVDGSAQSRQGFLLGLRMARVLETSLTPLRVVPERRGRVDAEELLRRVENEEATALAELEEFVEAVDTEGVEVTPRAMVGPPAARIIEASEDAGLLVIGSRGFDLLRPTSLGRVTEKVVRFSRIGVMTIRDPDPDREEREAQLHRVADLKQRGTSLLEAGDANAALSLLELAASLAPANAAVQERLADALEGVGRLDEAQHRRAFAGMIRERFT